jgi:hypothetical protein
VNYMLSNVIIILYLVCTLTVSVLTLSFITYSPVPIILFFFRQYPSLEIEAWTLPEKIMTATSITILPV